MPEIDVERVIGVSVATEGVDEHEEDADMPGIEYDDDQPMGDPVVCFSLSASASN